MTDYGPCSQPIDVPTLFDISGKTALVTGGSRGIGLMIARGFVEAGALEEYREKFEKACPLKRIGVPGDMAGVAIFLSSRAGSYLNGTVIPVDGGISLR